MMEMLDRFIAREYRILMAGIGRNDR